MRSKKNVSEQKPHPKEYPKSVLNTRNKIIIFNTTVNNYKKASNTAAAARPKKAPVPATARQSKDLSKCDTSSLHKSHTALIPSKGTHLCPPPETLFTSALTKARTSVGKILGNDSLLRKSGNTESEAISLSYNTGVGGGMDAASSESALLESRSYATARVKGDTSMLPERKSSIGGEVATRKGSINKRSAVSHQANVRVVARIRPPNKVETVYFCCSSFCTGGTAKQTAE